MASPHTFKIGLCLAGAVSAGAYTAGVIDYLIEALDVWQHKKATDNPQVPRHNVEISVIGGASAGGMTGIVTAAALHDEIQPIKRLNGDILQPQTQNKLYHSWVDLGDANIIDAILDNSDIKNTGLESLLNSDFIDNIADRVLKVENDSPVRRKYFAQNLKVFVTLSNLEGMDYSITFKASPKSLTRYRVTSHDDYACFMLAHSADDYKNDGWIPLNFKNNMNVELAKQAALATGSFPVGLKAREILREGRFLNDLRWLDYITKKSKNKFPDLYSTVNVDGGLLNNEPFEKVREVLNIETGQFSSREHQDPDICNSTVLMVDPFPSVKGEFQRTTGLFTIMGNTLGTMIDQSRLKSEHLINMMDDDQYGQFLIAPSRHVNAEESYEGSHAIAGGSLGGFGGFLSKEFRIHDYFLGRANCEKFLRDHFTVPFNTENTIFKNGYASVQNKTDFQSKAAGGGLQIIPIFGDMSREMYMPTFSNGRKWPTIDNKTLKSYRRPLRRRIQKVLMNIAEYSKTESILLWIGAKVLLNRKLTELALENITNGLQKHRLIQ